MKKILSILFMLSVISAESATLQVNSRNFTSEATARRRTTLTLIEAGPVVAGPWLVAGDSVSKFTDTNGVAYYSNVLAGAYRLDVAGTPGRSYPITVMDTNVLLNAADLVNSTNLNTSFYTAAQVDALLATAGAGVQVSAAQLAVPSTNAGVVTVTVSTNAVSELATNVTRFATRALGDNLINNGDGTISAYNRWQFDNILNGEQLNSWWINANGDAGFQYLTGKLAGASSVPLAVTNQWQADAQTAALNATNKFKADLAAGTVPVAASALTGQIDLSGTNSIHGQLLVSTNFNTTTNSASVLAYGGTHLSSTLYADGAANANWRGGINFWDSGWDGSLPLPNVSDTFVLPEVAIRSMKHWGGSSSLQPTAHFFSKGSIRLEPGFGGNTYNGLTYLTIGNEDSNSRIRINWMSGSETAYGTNRPNLSGYGLPLYFDASYSDNGSRAGFSQAAIWGRFARTNIGSADNNGVPVFPGELWFMPRGPKSDTTNRTYGVQSPTFHILAGRMLTNGWDFRGRTLNEQLFTTINSDTNVPLNFEAARFQTIDLNTTTTNLFYTTNFIAVSGFTNQADYVDLFTNAETKEFRIRAGALDRYLKWPSGWSVITPIGQGSLPTWLTNTTLLHLKLTAWGVGETNITAEWRIGSDNTFAYDPDALSFFTAASISDTTQKAAVDYLVKARKAADLWTNAFAIYPFVGGASNSHAVNLKAPANYPITFTSSGVTHNANGITGNGSSGYGDTGFNPTNVFGAVGVSNAFICVYNKTANPADCRFFGVTDTSGRFGFGKASTQLLIEGPMNNIGPNNYDTLGTDFTGFLALIKNYEAVGGAGGANQWFTGTRSAITERSAAPSLVPNRNIYILCRNGSGTPSNYSDANLAYAEISWYVNATEAATLRTIINNFQTILGRQ